MNSGAHLIGGTTGKALAITCPMVEGDNLYGLKLKATEA